MPTPMIYASILIKRHFIRYAWVLMFTMCFCLSDSFGQASGLKELVTKLEQTVGPVQTASKNYEQKITYQEPAGIRYSYDEKDQKGNTVNYVYEFNLADLDPYAVREQTQKDLISVVVAVRNKQKLIKVYKNEVVQAYDDQAMIIAKDIENARAITDIIKKAIPPAEKTMASRLKLNGYDAMAAWLTTNIKNVTISPKSFNQGLSNGETVGSMKLTRVEVDPKTSTEQVFQFNLADINPNEIVYKISGNQFAISFSMLQDSKYIHVRKNGEVKAYENSLSINTNNADEARDLKNVLTSIVPLAVEKVKAAMPQVSSDKDGLQKLQKLITEITIGTKQISQSLEGDCPGSLTQVEKDAKSSTKNVYTFNWMDVNPLSTKIDVAGDRLFIEVLFNDSKKLMMHTASDKFKGYDNAFKIYMPDIESGRSAKYVMDKLIEKCKAAYKEPFGNDAATTTTYFKNQIKEVSMDEMTLKQSIEPVEPGNNNKYKFTVTEVSPKGSGSEQVYEFSLSDINDLTIDSDVRGRWMYVVIETNSKAKIIKYYKDGKIQPYASTVQFAVNDVDVARNLVSALKKAVKAVKKN